ncbi:E3 ubiquitin-protein ligase HACE1 [Tolypocladium ophioglossoides CBS 100239]|uniref:E3 ubiquitin-protein ligase HACE1 n=1 Tax=Tolypocladium ophioglossoides (strain CBS 100239) TaxID=1163406 RepID=A0A0L0N104_TOLOC|nr:E3 ubiquitin-protein ligase HACE1 [Tolypocladium ophioglossoides CBS 100239]
MPASSASPSAQSTNTQTGRPSKWTKSAERKMIRLYVYTTLPMAKIIRLVHSRSPDPAPGIESGHKKLSSLLDKEPRWLHPRSETDMGRRVTQLSNSPTRLASAAEAVFDHETPVELEASTSPLPFDVSPFSTVAGASPAGQSLFTHHPPSGHPSAGASPALQVNAGPCPKYSGDGGVFSTFLRRTTCLSSSTDHTTGSFHRVLSNYSEPYVQTVKRLVKRFTAPIASRPSISTMSAGATTQPQWLDDDDGPRNFEGEPHPLPGDFLNLETYARQQLCHASREAHAQRQCPCFNQFDTYFSRWVTVQGLTTAARSLLEAGPTRSDVTDRDSSGNTVLHFLAARGSLETLFRALQTDICNPVLNARNTGGQTFLHVIKRGEMRRLNLLCQLLRLLSMRTFDIYARDIYGRNYFHLLHREGLYPEAMRYISYQYDVEAYNKRDAFGLMPAGQPAPPSGQELGELDSVDREWMDWDATQPAPLPAFSPAPSSGPAITKQVQFLANARLARLIPTLEDADGGNGLHSLAMSTLSCRTMAQKYRADHSGQVQPVRRQQNADGLADSCSTLLKLRHSLATGILEAGADPNHYDLNGNTPLMVFAAELPEDSDDYRTGPMILDLLVEHGADVHARNRAGETALHIAVRCGRKLAMNALVRHRANVHARDADGRSVLDVADMKMMSCRDEDPSDYAHYEACRAWLSSINGLAVQEPTVLDEWGCA